MKKILVSVLILALLISLTSIVFATGIKEIKGVWTFENETYFVLAAIDLNSTLSLTSCTKSSGGFHTYTYKVISDEYVENHFCIFYTNSDGSVK